jgi:integrase
MSSNKLTNKFCENAPTGTHFDGEGLYLHVMPNGKKYWRMAGYLNGKRKLLSFGTFPKVSLAEARDQRTKARELLQQGLDPVIAKKDLKRKNELEQARQVIDEGKSFEQIAIKLYESKKGRTTEEHRDRMLAQLKSHVFPIIGNKSIEEIKSSELLKLFKDVSQKKNHNRLMTYCAKRLCQWCSEVFDYASLLIDDFCYNPCRVIVKHLPKHDVRNMLRIEFSQLKDFLIKLKAYQGHPVTKAAIWMMLYTGVRQISIRRAQVQDFDLENLIWNRQPEKTDKLIHPLPLPKQAIACIEETYPYHDSHKHNLMFSGTHVYNKLMSENCICQALKKMGFKMVGHGIRGLVSTGLNELGYKPHIVDVQLGHKRISKVEAAYNKAGHFDERRKMMQEWADYLDKLLTN